MSGNPNLSDIVAWYFELCRCDHLKKVDRLFGVTF
jgi:hypothetical protein